MIRVGQGVDAHRLVDGRALIIGGVRLDYPEGLAAHSDGDVLLHAITDAILGALGEGDIGQHFPDTDAAWKDADSRVLLREITTRMQNQQFQLANIDATVIAQKPKMSGYLPKMRQNIASDLGCAEAQINLKATTTEWMGFTGRGEGIAAMAVALLESIG